MEMSPLIWLRADYHLPATYSCRVPMSSIASARALPAPGPATVRLALIRTAIEVFGINQMEAIFFPHLRAMPIHIRPPERVAITSHTLHAYKEDDTRVSQAPILREMAHAQGPISIYLQVPAALQEALSLLLRMIGYWGQSSSLAWCTHIEPDAPQPQQCVLPLSLFSGQFPLANFFCTILSEFRDPSVTWQQIMPLIAQWQANPLRLDLYVWPLLLTAQHGTAKLFVHTPLPALSHQMN
jgi:hypothetical protein